jgi:hypothetical protein
MRLSAGVFAAFAFFALPAWAADDCGEKRAKVDIAKFLKNLPKRQGDKPQTTPAPVGTNLAHQQISQNAPRELQEEVYARVGKFPGIETYASQVSVQGARAFTLRPSCAKAPKEFFMEGTEFGHLHPPYDGSVHVRLPVEVAKEVFSKGWGEPHPRGTTPMLYGPRDKQELEIVVTLIEIAYQHATGRSAAK